MRLNEAKISASAASSNLPACLKLCATLSKGTSYAAEGLTLS